MSLLQRQKDERRARILAAAKRLVARHGFESLTMRDLAEAAQVSVPTLYSLFGSKEGLLLAEARSTVRVLTTSFAPREGDVVDRVLAIYQAGARVVGDMPDYYKRLLQVLVTSPEAQTTRVDVEAGFIDMMAAVLADGQRDGLLAGWVDPAALSREMWSRYVIALGRWALGDLPAERFLDTTVFGMSLTLLGVARGTAVARLERLARDTQEATS